MINKDPNVVVLSRTEWETINMLAGAGEQQIGDGKLRRVRRVIQRRNQQLRDEAREIRAGQMQVIRSLKRQFQEARRICSSGGYLYLKTPAEPGNIYSHATMPHPVRPSTIKFIWPIGLKEALARILVHWEVEVDGQPYRYRQFLNPTQLYADELCKVPFFTY